MKLSDVKEKLKTVESIIFKLPNGKTVPKHFHVTEVGLITKNFIDCGGVVREEKKINFQLWEEQDYDHRLAPQKLYKIIELSEKTLNLENLEIEVEYQNDTIGKYNLAYDNGNFLLLNKQTDCLAKDNCGVEEKPKENLRLSELKPKETSCTPGGGCC